MTKEQAVALAKTKWWEERSAVDIVSFQLFEPLLCMDFGAFHQAVEEVLGRPVFTHEFGWAEYLRAEFLKERPAPTLEEILSLIPKDKRIIVGI